MKYMYELKKHNQCVHVTRHFSLSKLQLNGKATLQLSPTSTTIHNCHDEKLRALIKEAIFRQLIQI